MHPMHAAISHESISGGLFHMQIERRGRSTTNTRSWSFKTTKFVGNTIRVALWNREVVFCSPSKSKLRLPSVEIGEIWKENQL